MREIKLCKNCIHHIENLPISFIRIFYRDFSKCAISGEIDVVTGERINNYCELERRSGILISILFNRCSKYGAKYVSRRDIKGVGKHEK